MNDEPATIIPFGKHKGKTVEEVQVYDPGYLDWLTGQAWFRDKFVILHQTIINRGAEPEETPDHNRLQALFLDDAFCLKVAKAARMVWQRELPEGAVIQNRQFEVRGIDVVYGVNHDSYGVEIKPSVGDDYPSVLRQIHALKRGAMIDRFVLFLERYVGEGATCEQFIAMFKAAGIAVVFRHQVS